MGLGFGVWGLGLRGLGWDACAGACAGRALLCSCATKAWAEAAVASVGPGCGCRELAGCWSAQKAWLCMAVRGMRLNQCQESGVSTAEKVTVKVTTAPHMLTSMPCTCFRA